MRIHCLQHEDFEHPAYIGEWAANNGHPMTITRVDKGESFPPLIDFDMLLVLGALASVYEVDDKPEVQREMAFIKGAVDNDKKVLGICFGAQLLAASIGGKVIPNCVKEIGWHTVSKSDDGKDSNLFSTFPKKFDVLLWHGDTFSIPPGATCTLRSKHCLNEAFVLNERVVGLQILPQVTLNNLEEFIDVLGSPEADGDSVQGVDTIRSRARTLVSENNAYLTGLLDRLAQ